MQSSVFAQRFAARLCVPRVTLQTLALRLVFVPLACAYSYRGMRMAECDVLNKNILNKKKPPCGGLVYSLNARVSSGHNVMACSCIRLSMCDTADGRTPNLSAIVVTLSPCIR